MPDRVHGEVRDRVLTVVLDRPDRLNAITSQTLLALLELLDRARARDVALVVVTGAGGAFCAGQDLEELEKDLAVPDEAAAGQSLAAFQAVTERVLSLPKPVVAAVNGIAVGFGAELALACDLRLAATTARIGFVEATRGLFQTNGVTWLLPRVIGHGAAARMLFTGELVGAAEALRLGLVSSVHSPEELAGATDAVVERLLDNAPLSLQLVKQAMNSTWSDTLDQALQREVAGMQACLASEDLAEGTRAFLERRRPVYRGR